MYCMMHLHTWSETQREKEEKNHDKNYRTKQNGKNIELNISIYRSLEFSASLFSCHFFFCHFLLKKILIDVLVPHRFLSWRCTKSQTEIILLFLFGFIFTRAFIYIFLFFIFVSVSLNFLLIRIFSFPCFYCCYCIDTNTDFQSRCPCSVGVH